MKKLVYLFVIAFMSLVSCSDDNEKKADIDITACGVYNPEWLLENVDKVIGQSEHKRIVFVFLIEHDSQEYFMICDVFNSSMVDGNKFYTCDGQLVNPEESLYNDLLSLFNERKRVLLWNN